MRKLIFILIIVMISIVPAFAFNYGTDTYATDSGSLILNSLGDQVTNSTFLNLGSNDFISENAAKNQLSIDGYSKAYDYNPQNTLGQFSGVYNTSLPTGVELTKLQIGGFLGNPRAIQDIYVLTSEYNRLSAEGQANSIDTLNASQNVQNTNISNNNTQITTVDNNSINRDNILQSNINSESITRASADNTLQNNINTEATNRQNTDNILQNNINTIDNKVKKLEQTQGIIGAEVRVYDGKKWTVTTFVDFTTTRNTVDRAGVKFTYKLGKSYEEAKIDELEAKINHLTSFSQGKAEQPSTSEVYTEGGTIGIREKF